MYRIISDLCKICCRDKLIKGINNFITFVIIFDFRYTIIFVIIFTFRSIRFQ